MIDQREVGTLGDAVERALGIVGVSSQRVERWLGRRCRCKERREQLNSLEHWARRVLAGKLERAAAYLDTILSKEP